MNDRRTQGAESVTMTEPNSNGHYQPGPREYPPIDAAPEHCLGSTPDGLGWWTSTLLTLMGIEATADRQSESTTQAMKIVMAAGLVLLVVFGAMMAYAVLKSFW